MLVVGVQFRTAVDWQNRVLQYFIGQSKIFQVVSNEVCVCDSGQFVSLKWLGIPFLCCGNYCLIARRFVSPLQVESAYFCGLIDHPTEDSILSTYV